MGLKSAFREKSPEEIPASEKIKIDGEPATDAVEPPNPAVLLAISEQGKADEATERLRQHLADLQRAQALQHRAMLEQRIPNHTEKLAMWKAQGMSDGDHAFLASNPDMVANE